MMFWFFVWQPVSVPVVGFIPIFLLPMTGVMSSPDVCSSYFNVSLNKSIYALNLENFDEII